MEVIDAQIHVWEIAPSRPWDPAFDYGTDREHPFPIEYALAAMDAIGIEAAVISLPPSYRSPMADGVYRYDNSYAEEAALRYPGRFASVQRWDPRDPELDRLAKELRDRPGTLGVRATLVSDEEWEIFRAGGYEPLFTAAERHQVPLMFFVSGHADEAGRVARAHPELTLVIDHLGLRQPPYMPADPDPFERLPLTLGLARFPNVSIKLSGAPSLSREPYPFADLWPALHRVVEAFGPDRLMWGSDVTRVRSLHNWSQAVDFIRCVDELSQADKEAILAHSLRRILRWPRL
jgi:L-fuconolactonase